MFCYHIIVVVMWANFNRPTLVLCNWIVCRYYNNYYSCGSDWLQSQSNCSSEVVDSWREAARRFALPFTSNYDCTIVPSTFCYLLSTIYIDIVFISYVFWHNELIVPVNFLALVMYLAKSELNVINFYKIYKQLQQLLYKLFSIISSTCTRTHTTTTTIV